MGGKALKAGMERDLHPAHTNQNSSRDALRRWIANRNRHWRSSKSADMLGAERRPLGELPEVQPHTMAVRPPGRQPVRHSRIGEPPQGLAR